MNEKDETIKSLREENQELKDNLGVIHYELTRLDPLLGMPDKGYVRNGYNQLLSMSQVDYKPDTVKMIESLISELEKAIEKPTQTGYQRSWNNAINHAIDIVKGVKEI